MIKNEVVKSEITFQPKIHGLDNYSPLVSELTEFFRYTY